MKKFLMYVVVLVGILFIGYTTYYFVRNNETISMTLAENESVYINKDETCELPIKWTKPYSSTKLEIKVLNEKIAVYNEETKLFTGVGGGTTTVEIIPSNKNFGPFRFDIHVGDGSLMYPFTIKKEIELGNIGKNEKYTLNSSYILINDLDLSSYENWEPIGVSLSKPFTGTFDGNFKSISNMKITSATNAGLFGAIDSSAVVSNLILNNADFNGAFDNAGAIAGQSKGIIRLCKVNNFKLTNTKENSNNGGVVGYMINNSTDNNFVSFGYVELTTAQVTASTNGSFGGIAGYMAGSAVMNSKVIVSSYTTMDNSLFFGSIAGKLEDAVNTTKYTFSVIKNSLAIVEHIAKDNTSTVLGALIGKNIDRNIGGYSNIIKSCYYACTDDVTEVVGNSATTLDLTKVFKRDVLDLKQKVTFIGWNFDTIWTTQDDTVINEINVDTAQPEAINEYIPGEPINTKEDFLRIIEAIRQNPSSGVVYEIKSNIDLDLEGNEWQTIAPVMTRPMTCSLVCDEGVTITIRNGKISGNNSSFFGYISGVNTKVNNIIYKDITVNSNAKNVALVATALLDNATLDNIQTQNCEVYGSSNTDNIAVVVATNNGVVSGAKVNVDAGNVNTLKTESTTATMGIISAINNKTISNAVVDSYEIIATSQSIDATAQIGGISGVNNGAITDAHNLGAALDIDFRGTIYAGGVTSKLSDGAKVESSYAISTLKVPYTNKNSHMGGVVAYSNNGSIKTSFFRGIVEGYNASGICEINSGYIDQCYAVGEMKGTIVSGIVNYNNSSITNCYVSGKVTGMTSDAVANGICYTLPEGSSVNHCFVNVSYADGLGKKNAESNEEFRAEFEKVFGPLFNVYPKTGTLTNSIIINYEDANVKGTFFNSIKNGWIDCSNEEANGQKGDYEKFKNDAKFDQSIWVFDPNTNGGYPYLKNTPVVE